MLSLTVLASQSWREVLCLMGLVESEEKDDEDGFFLPGLGPCFELPSVC